MRTVIVGPSGVGKTTLAKALAEKNRTPFISASAKNLFDCYGFKDHKDIINCGISDPKKGLQFQIEIMQTRIGLFQKTENFISDRSPIDVWVYFLIQHSSQLSGAQCSYMGELFDKGLRTFDKIIYLPYINEIEIEVDDVRITNPYFQYMVNSVFDKLIEDLRLTDKFKNAIWKTTERDFECKLEICNIWLNTQ